MKLNSTLFRVIMLPAFLMVSACSSIASSGTPAPAETKSFEDCVAAGNPVMKTLPPRCRTSDGRVFVGPGPVTKPTCKDTCGNGACEEVVCTAEGCPCPEGKETCSKDCQ